MLVHTWFFLACLPVVSHVWGRVGQGKEPACPFGAVPCGLSVPGMAQPLPLAVALLRGRFPKPGRIPGGCCALVSVGEAPNSLSQA